MKDQGIEEKYIKTVNYSIYPNYRYEQSSGRSIIDGYKAESRLEVKVKDFDKLTKVIDTATVAGANEVGTVNFTVDERDQFVAEARSQAIQKAKDKAVAIAQETGISLGKIVDVQIGEGDGVQPPTPMYAGYGGMADVKSSTEISTGENAIVVTATLVYETQ